MSKLYMLQHDFLGSCVTEYIGERERRNVLEEKRGWGGSV